MSGHRDPTRTSTFELTKGQVLEQMLAIADLKLKEGWWFSKGPYSLSNKPPTVMLILADSDFGLPFLCALRLISKSAVNAAFLLAEE